MYKRDEATRSGRERIARWAAAVAVLIAFLCTARPFWGLTTDDAFITFRYGRNWVSGCGPVYNCGQPPVEGYTNFLWMTLSAAGMALKLDPVLFMRSIGWWCGLGGALAAALLAFRLYRARWAALFPAILLGCSPFWAVNAVAGLETPLATLSVLVAVIFSLSMASKGKPALAGLAWAVSALVRPEASVFAAVTAAWAGWRGVKEHGWKPTCLTMLKFAAGYGLVAIPYFLWKAFFYGDLLPNSYYAKKLPLAEVLPKNIQLLLEHPFFFASIAALALIALLVARRVGTGYVFTLALVSSAISLSVHNNFWMPGHRLYLTAITLFAVVGSGALVAPVRGASHLALRYCRYGVACVAAGAAIGMGWWAFPETLKAAQTHYARDNHPAKEMAAKIRSVAVRGDWLAIRDAGMIPYYVGPAVNVLDMHDRSLNDRTIARHGFDPRYVFAHQPRFIVLASYSRDRLDIVHPVENQLLYAPTFAGQFRWQMTRPWNSLRYYWLFVRK